MSPILIAVEPLSKRTKLSLLLGLWHPLMLETISILLLDDDGVMLTDIPVMSVNDVDDVVKVSVLVVLTTCNTRNAPRKSFICAAVKTLPATKVDGRVVTAAIVLLYPMTARWW